ncbi:DUF4326 domain-containing protein [Phaeovibrio sulfidiphilus]|uniref:DUF4326 domain-containing protein n=1 Tax=Phaeovibrio sulfidiphilus TaxID=1220600 RepID=A0A8J6YRB3_9PROT|nr:DUF4326 domain-containing protein [Phaeovibrio sulfidiphilus]MBE1238002.1 DUF4326 domain-containing protein [Phaeovibrio sulfidiphilus]
MTARTPERIQRRRTKGWSLETEAERLGCTVRDIVYVGRGTPWGNPFLTGVGSVPAPGPLTPALRARLVEHYRTWLLKEPGHETLWAGPDADRCRETALEALGRLRGKHLSCYCPLDGPCHADVLLDLANRPDTGDR